MKEKIYHGGVYMQTSIKKQLAEMISDLDFPMLFYVYESNALLAVNAKANKILQEAGYKDSEEFWLKQSKVQLSKEWLKQGGSQCSKSVLQTKDGTLLDIEKEIFVITIGREHLVICLFEKIEKEAFSIENRIFLPGIMWYPGTSNAPIYSLAVQRGAEHFKKVFHQKQRAKEQDLERYDASMNLVTALLESDEAVYGKTIQMDFNPDRNGFVSVNYLPIHGKDNLLLGRLLIGQPIFTQKEYKKLAEQIWEEKQALLLHCMDEDKILFCVEKTSPYRIKKVSANVELLGYHAELLYQQEASLLDLIFLEDVQRVQEELNQRNKKSCLCNKQKYRICDAKKEVQWVDTELYEFSRGESSDTLYIVMCKTMLEDKEEARFSTKREAYYDILTSLPNRMKFEREGEQLIRAALASRKKGYVIAIDLDDFKHINEGLGPEYGDSLLVAIAEALNAIPQVHNYCYRIDGDEFLLFVRGEYEKEIEHIIQQCLEMFRSNWKIKDKDCFCSVSIGITEYPKDSVKTKELLKYADAAVFEAKRKGKNRIQHYKKAVLNTSVERVNYEKYLRKAIAKGCMEFVMFFQPVVTAQTKELVSAEALVRWYSPELGFIAPINFISLSEYLGLIVPLGEYVLQQTFLQCKYWNDQYNPDFRVSINLSVVQLVQPNIVERILEIARATQVRTENIIFEVTESLAIEDMGIMKKVLLQLKENGFRIALDDFGTGYSSINHIMKMPLDYIKIDKSFVQGYGTEQFNPRILSATVELAHSVNTEVVVEGVETIQQMEFLMFLNADKIQGYLYGKPMPAEEFESKFFGGK